MVKMNSPFSVEYIYIHTHIHIYIYIYTYIYTYIHTYIYIYINPTNSFENSIMIHFVVLQITQHKWAWPFMDPVDVEGLRLHDYYEVRPFICFKAFLSV